MISSTGALDSTLTILQSFYQTKEIRKYNSADSIEQTFSTCLTQIREVLNLQYSFLIADGCPLPDQYPSLGCRALDKLTTVYQNVITENRTTISEKAEMLAVAYIITRIFVDYLINREVWVPSKKAFVHQPLYSSLPIPPLLEKCKADQDSEGEETEFSPLTHKWLAYYFGAISLCVKDLKRDDLERYFSSYGDRGTGILVYQTAESKLGFWYYDDTESLIHEDVFLYPNCTKAYTGLYVSHVVQAIEKGQGKSCKMLEKQYRIISLLDKKHHFYYELYSYLKKENYLSSDPDEKTIDAMLEPGEYCIHTHGASRQYPFPPIIFSCCHPITKKKNSFALNLRKDGLIVCDNSSETSLWEYINQYKLKSIVDKKSIFHSHQDDLMTPL
jgi:hypothetical protein